MDNMVKQNIENVHPLNSNTQRFADTVIAYAQRNRKMRLSCNDDSSSSTGDDDEDDDGNIDDEKCFSLMTKYIQRETKNDFVNWLHAVALFLSPLTIRMYFVPKKNKE